MAMKVQKEIGSLAWEYVVMRRIQDRLGGRGEGYLVKMPQLQLFSDGAYCLMETPVVAWQSRNSRDTGGCCYVDIMGP